MPSLWDAVPLLYIPATRVNIPSWDIFSQTMYHEHDRDEDGDFAPYVPNVTLKDLFDSHFGNSVGNFDGIYLEGAIDWLRRETAGFRGQQNQFRKALEVGYSCANSICPEVLYDNVPHPYVEVDEDHEFSDTGRIVHYGMGVVPTDDILGEPLYAGVLSSGTQGTLLWIYALSLKMASHYRWEEGWEKKPAILLIDEIENHLHPTWQRRVIPALLDKFPTLQIFATTHSPFVVAGRKAGQVHQLRRDEHGNVTATPITENIIGWTADEICRQFLDVVDPTDAVTAAAAEELRQLRNEGPRSDEKEEEQRQLRIQELRQHVNRDLLEGGPRAAQRKAFEERFAEELERYRQSKNLNQENG